MEVIFRRNFLKQPLVSIILIDWSVRESFHIFDYLANQTVPREDYEIIWIEYYERRPKEIDIELKKCAIKNVHPILDAWIVMGMPKNVHYHKHLMYNVGIAASSGWIVTICDSDTIALPTFVESIINSFKEDKNIVLHIDQIRSFNRKFYPFNYPTIEEIMNAGCLYSGNANPVRNVDRWQNPNVANYGACMSALREDLISIGGSDEHESYVGYICGPYEMTFRLVNSGKKELWHSTERLYHLWHPGDGGAGNYFGKHDGAGMSTTALEASRSGRVLPFAENPYVKILRVKNNIEATSFSIDSVVSHIEISKLAKKTEQKNWLKIWITILKNLFSIPIIMGKFILKPGYGIRYITVRLILLKMLMKALYFKAQNISDLNKEIIESCEGINKLQVIPMAIKSFKCRVEYHEYILEKCKECLSNLASETVGKVVLYGTGPVTKILYLLSKDYNIKVIVLYNGYKKKSSSCFNVCSLQSLKDYKGKIIVASFVDIEKQVEEIGKMGIRNENIVVLQ